MLALADEGAFDWLVQRNRPGMLRVARGILDSPELAEDVVQETFESVVKDIGSFRGESRLSSWMYRILVNRAHRVGKREKRMVPVSTFALESHAVLQDKSAVDPQQQVINRQGLDRVAEQLERLPERQRAVVVLRDVQGLASDEVQAMLHVSPGNQRVLLHRGRTALRRALEAGERPGSGLLN
jgi:RNA polymerase sigma-70 factor (ECF subfamily)